jgi:hypothetical protein
MLELYNCYPIIYEFNGKVFCRNGAQIYNDMANY